MIHWILRALEAAPARRFFEDELRQLGGAEFEEAIDAEILIRSREPARSVVREGRFLTVEIDSDGLIEASDDEDAEFEPIALQMDEIALWELSREPLVKRLAEANCIVPDASELSPVVLQIGRAAKDVPVVLVLAGTREAFVDAIDSLVHLLPSTRRGAIALLPSYLPPADLLPWLDQAGVAVAHIEPVELTARPDLQRLASQLTGGEPLGMTHPESGFRLAPDQRTAYYQGRSYGLAPKEGQAIALLLRALCEGTPDLTQAYILETIESKASDLGSVFRRSPVWHELVESVERGKFRLKV